MAKSLATIFILLSLICHQLLLLMNGVGATVLEERCKTYVKAGPCGDAPPNDDGLSSSTTGDSNDSDDERSNDDGLSSSSQNLGLKKATTYSTKGDSSDADDGSETDDGSIDEDVKSITGDSNKGDSSDEWETDQYTSDDDGSSTDYNKEFPKCTKHCKGAFPGSKTGICDYAEGKKHACFCCYR